MLLALEGGRGYCRSPALLRRWSRHSGGGSMPELIRGTSKAAVLIYTVIAQ